MKLNMTFELPNWTRFVAVNHEGCLAAYETRPIAIENDSYQGWLLQGGQFQEIVSIHHTCSDWKNLLWELTPQGARQLLHNHQVHDLEDWLTWTCDSDDPPSPPAVFTV